MPEPEIMHQKPEPVPMNSKPLKAVHYGRNIENIIDLIAGKEDGEMKIAMIRQLAIYMRQQYLIWNKDSVSDETIFQDIEKLSDYRIKVPEGIQLNKVQHDGGHNRQNSAQGRQKNHRQKNNQKMRKQHK